MSKGIKLRNKKTGEIVGLSIYGIEVHIRKEEQPFYHSLAELNEEWEDYKEPLIKDEKVRKAVRAWADSNRAYPIYCEDNCTLSYNHAPRIEFENRVFANLDGRPYTITELCGEEE